jgi:hypothetical protein
MEDTVKIEIPVSEIKKLGIANINYSDLSSEFKEEIYEEFKSHMLDDLDIENKIERAMEDAIDNVKDDIDVSSDVSDKVTDMISDYQPNTTCSTAREVASAICNTIRWDLMTYNKSEASDTASNFRHHLADSTIIDELTKFVDKRVEERIEKEKQEYLANKKAYMEKDNTTVSSHPAYKTAVLTFEEIERVIMTLGVDTSTRVKMREAFTAAALSKDNVVLYQ